MTGEAALQREAQHVHEEAGWFIRRVTSGDAPCTIARRCAPSPLSSLCRSPPSPASSPERRRSPPTPPRSAVSSRGRRAETPAVRRLARARGFMTPSERSRRRLLRRRHDRRVPESSPTQRPREMISTTASKGPGSGVALFGSTVDALPNSPALQREQDPAADQRASALHRRLPDPRSPIS